MVVDDVGEHALEPEQAVVSTEVEEHGMDSGQHGESSAKATCHDALARDLVEGGQQDLEDLVHWWVDAAALHSPLEAPVVD